MNRESAEVRACEPHRSQKPSLRDIRSGLNILMVCYYYPPVTDVGSKRSVAFSKYFKKNGWSPSVLSVKNPDRYYCSVGHDVPPDGVPTRILVLRRQRVLGSGQDERRAVESAEARRASR